MKSEEYTTHTIIDAVSQYKRVLQTVLERRPSGTRQKLAEVLGKNRSFVSQIANPAYKTPIPVKHLEAIFDICHFSKTEKKQFYQAYTLAHPDRIPAKEIPLHNRSINIRVPDLGSDSKNRQLELLIKDFSVNIFKLLKSS